MTPLFRLLLVSLLLVSCKSNNSEDSKTTEKQETLTTAQKIANASGFEQWQNVSQLDFTFNVDRDSTHFERTWSWQPSKNLVTLISNSDTISYNRAKIDSLSLGADRAFINDKYWLLVPFQLVWDSSASIKDTTNVEAPLSKKMMNKLTITYPSDGGYTPGDAYDLYFEDDYLIKEWVYRRGNKAEPSLITTFENYVDYNGIKLATDHKQANANWNLNFSNISVKVD